MILRPRHVRTAPSMSALVLVALSGCLVTPDAGNEGGDDERASALRFSTPLELGEGPVRSPEPIVETFSDTGLFIAAIASPQDDPNQRVGASWLWRSLDGGDSWDTLRAPGAGVSATVDRPGPFGTWDVDVRASGDGWVYYTDFWTAYPGPPVSAFIGPGNLMVERSNDDGVTWTSTPITIPEPALFDRQWLLTGPDGLVGLFWASSFEPGNIGAAATGYVSALKAVFSHDHGATWSTAAPTKVVPPVPDSIEQIARPFVIPGGPIVMPYTNTPGISRGADEDDRPARYWLAPTQIAIAMSEDQGETWTQRVVANAPEGLDNLWALQGAADDVGNAYLAWAAREGDHIRVFFIESHDSGRSWTAPTALSAPGFAVLPWVAATGNGTVAVAWYFTEGSGRSEGAAAETAWFPQVALRRHGDGFVMANASNAPVKYGPWCAKGNNCVDAVGTNELRDFLSVAFDRAERVHLAYAEAVRGNDVMIGHTRYVRELD